VLEVETRLNIPPAALAARQIGRKTPTCGAGMIEWG
jgi:hypothetical protein